MEQNENKERIELTQEMRDRIQQKVLGGFESGVKISDKSDLTEVVKQAQVKATEIEKTLAEKNELPIYVNQTTGSPVLRNVTVKDASFTNKDGQKIDLASLTYKNGKDSLVLNVNENAKITSATIYHNEFVSTEEGQKIDRDKSTKTSINKENLSEVPAKFKAILEASGFEAREVKKEFNGEYSDTFKTYDGIRKSLLENSKKVSVPGEDGSLTEKSDVYASNFTSYENKDGEKRASFEVRDHENHSIRFNLDADGQIKFAELVDWSGYEKGKDDAKTWATEHTTKNLKEGADGKSHVCDVREILPEGTSLKEALGKALDDIGYKWHEAKEKDAPEVEKDEEEAELPFD